MPKGEKGFTGNSKRKRPKISDVEDPNQSDSVKLPDWISKKSYITDNVDALKYEPDQLLGAIARIYDDKTFEVYTISFNVRKEDSPPSLVSLAKPTNFYEQTYDLNTRFNSSFIIGGLNVGHNEILKISYLETNYGILKSYDNNKLESIRSAIKKIDNVNLNDWAIIRGVVTLDCMSSRNVKTEASANVNASWIKVDGNFYVQTGNTDNFRLISIDLEGLFLESLLSN